MPEARRFWGLLGCAAVIGCRLPSFFQRMFDDDEAQYGAVAELVRAGGKLYASGGVDFKFPGIYWTYAGVFSIFGRYAMWAVHAVALAAVAGTAAILWRLAGRGRTGCLAAIFYGVFTTVYYPKMLAANTEVFMMLPLSAAVLLAVEAREKAPWGRMFAAGALVGVACFWKQIAILNLAVVAAAALGTSRWFGRAAIATLGFAVALAAGLGIVAATGTLSGMWHWCVELLITRYGASAWKGSLLWHLAVGFLPFVACSILLWIAAGAAAVRTARARDARGLILFGWLAVSFVSSVSGGHFFGHYFIQLCAPLAAIAAIEIDRAWARGWIRAGTAALTALPAIGFFVVALLYEPVTEQVAAPPSPEYRNAVAWVRAHTTRDDRIFVWGMFPTMYLYADRLPASRFVGFLRGVERDRGADPSTGWDMGPEVWPALADDFGAHPPAVVVDTATADFMHFAQYPMTRFPVGELVARDYVPAAVVDGVTMYVPRRSLPGAP